VHGPPLVRAVLELARERPGPVLAHGFGTWSWVGVRACARLRALDREAVAVAGAYDTYPVAKAMDARGLGPGTGLRLGLAFRAEALWSRVAIARYEGFAYRNAAAVFVNYESVRRMIHATYGPGIRVRDLSYAPELDFDPAGDDEPLPAQMPELDPAGAPLVVCVSFHRPHKGVDVLIDALALARDRGVPLRACIVGMGPLLEPHRRLIAARGLRGTAVAIGPVADVRPYVEAADIYALPSRSEQSGSLALLEALRAGLPAVASRVDGIPEDVDDGDSALLVSPGDPGDLADALIRLAGDPSLRARLGKRGRLRFEERFSADAFTEDLGAAYEQLGFAASRAPAATGGAVAA
jgi:glycosyltransferase involved in cell wall biosynthesis